ncbi:ABC transporter ATP-binding protein [Desulfovibrio inopinatus]|uniref:ABC transporter ATP-binding protein n=1 Tax=Desulfovibrio inopinatus TaxID=102109 RepID=UPI0004094923|nr:ABC transporter ATP-binding protein [Desulfovibrio inopinatus]
MSENIITARGLRKVFGDFIAVDGIDFDVPGKQVFSLLGPNGAGKTTTIRMLYGFSPKTSGDIRMFGLDIDTRWREIRSRLGVCQQHNTLDPDLSVEENLLIFAGYFRIPQAEAARRAAELLEFFALEGKRRLKNDELSGGMARRLILARALINRPELLILDEPTTGLDPQSRFQLWERLKELKRNGLTILLTTHYMEEAAVLSDDLIIMDHGKVIVHGRPEHLVAEHVGQTVVEIEDPSQEVVEAVKKEGFRFDTTSRRIHLYLNKDQEASANALRERHHVSSWAMRPATLEDVFLCLTGRELRE